MSADSKLMGRAHALQQKSVREHQAGTARRREALCQKKPRLLELDYQIRARFLAALRQMAPGAMDRAEEDIRALQEEQAAILRDLGVEAGDYAGRPLCPLCKDTGLWEDAPCECVWERYRALQAKELSSLLNLEGQNFDCFDPELYSGAHDPGLGGSPRQQIELIYEICVNFSRRFGPDSENLVFSGPPGTGKTFMSSCVAGAVNERGFSVVYDTAVRQLQKMEALHFGRGDGDTETDILRIRRCDLLIIDDLGVEFLSPFAHTALMDIINTRLIERRPMLVSTNLAAPELRERYKGPLASRLLGQFLWLDFRGEDLRQRKM